MGAGKQQGPQFRVGEKVLAYHGAILYYARVMDLETMSVRGKLHIQYKIRYSGSAENSDEIVPQKRLLKNTEKNRKLKVMLDEDLVMEKSTQPTVESKPTPARNKQDVVVKGLKPCLETNITIPDELQLILRYVHDQYCKDLLIHLPCTPSLRKIFSYFSSYIQDKKASGMTPWETKQHIEALQELVAAFLTHSMLYRNERKIYAILHAKPSFSTLDTFGGAHLLRFFTMLPVVFSYTTTIQSPIENKASLIWILRNLIQFLAHHRHEYFNHPFIPLQQFLQQVKG